MLERAIDGSGRSYEVRSSLLLMNSEIRVNYLGVHSDKYGAYVSTIGKAGEQR